MSLPTIVKSWGHRQDYRVANPGTVQNQNKDLFLALLATLKGSGLVQYANGGGGAAFTGNVYSCKGSSNGSAAGNNDNTDRISARADIVHAASGTAHSWWVGRVTLTGVTGFTYAEILVDFNIVDANSAAVAVYGSLVGFGAANGGTDGTTTNRPTATDEFAMGTNATTAAQWLPTTASGDYLLNVSMSGDGQIMRCYVKAGTDAEIAMALEFEKLSDPDPGWNKPFVGRQFRATGGVNKYTVASADYASGNYYGMRNGGGRFIATCLVLSPANVSTNRALGNVNTGSNAYNGGPDNTEITMATIDASHQGGRGKRFDAWWMPTTFTDSNTYPTSAPAKTHRVSGNMLLPNNGNTPVLS